MFQMISTMSFSLASILFMYLCQGIQFHHAITISCLYDTKYWVGIIIEVSTENFDVKVKFMHPKIPTPSIKWSSCDDLCRVPNVHVCHIIFPPELSFQTGRMYYFNTSECEKIEKTIALHKNTLKIKYNCYYSFWTMS